MQHAELQAAFVSFGAASSNLTGAFESLQGRVTQLSDELALERAAHERASIRLAAIIDGLPGGVLVLDAGETILECNSTARDLLNSPQIGESFEAVLGRNLVDAGRLFGNLELRSGRFVNLTRRSFAESGIVLLTDVTEAHLMQTFLTRQQRLLTLGELAAGLAHQIRTPLAAALLYASQMNLPNREPGDLTRCAAKTVERLRELNKLIDEMLAFARGAGQLESVCVSALLEQAAYWLRPSLGTATRLTIRTEAPELKVRVNAPSLVSAILNLVTNAMQSARGDLEIELLARRSPTGHAQMLVSDNGPGIPAHLADRVFEPFFTTRARGTGLGLAIVRSVVEAHRGQVRLEPAPGTCFVIELPAEG